MFLNPLAALSMRARIAGTASLGVTGAADRLIKNRKVVKARDRIIR
jgi:hypothetical protein